MFPAAKAQPVSKLKELPKDVPKDDIWLADGDMLVLKGGTPSDITQNNIWPPLDDYQAPYRKPILAPANPQNLKHLGKYVVVIPPPPKRIVPRQLNPYDERFNEVVPYSTNAKFGTFQKIGAHQNNNNKAFRLLKKKRNLQAQDQGWVPSHGYVNMNRSNDTTKAVPIVVTRPPRHLWSVPPQTNKPLIGQFKSVGPKRSSLLGRQDQQDYKTRAMRKAELAKLLKTLLQNQEKTSKVKSVNYIPYQKNYGKSLVYNQAYSQSLKSIQDLKIDSDMNGHYYYGNRVMNHFLPTPRNKVDKGSFQTVKSRLKLVPDHVKNYNYPQLRPRSDNQLHYYRNLIYFK